MLLVSTPAVMLLLDRLDLLDRPIRWLLWGSLALIGLTFWDVLGRDLFKALMMSRVLTVCALFELGVSFTCVCAEPPDPGVHLY